MNNLTLSLIFLVLAVFGVVLRKTYYALPMLELKRRAEHRDKTAAKLYKAVAYGNSLRTLLWIYIALSSAASLILLARVIPVWSSLLIISVLLWLIFSLIPASRISKLGTWLTGLATPIIAWLLYYLHPLLSRGADRVEKRYVAKMHTGIFERSDLVALIDRQQQQDDSRISKEELEIVKRALKFDTRKISGTLIPRKKVKSVLASDTIGPVLINEFHEANQDYVVVKESAKGKVVGTLAFKDLNLSSQGQVRGLMDDTLYYLHENDSLSEALHAFFVTNHSLFIVVNNFEEYTGLITIEAVLKQLLGHVPGEDFEEYTNIAAVASRHTPKDDENVLKEEAEPVKTEEKVIE